MKNLIIIPIKDGSTRLPGKCFKQINGLPLYQYTINYALENKDESDIVILLCKDCVIQGDGCLTYIQNKNSMWESLFDLSIEAPYNNLILLQPTSPIRKPDMLTRLNYLMEEGFESGQTFTKYKRKLCVNDGGFASPITYEFHQPYQSMEELYYENGQGYICSRDYFLRNKKMLGEDVGMVIDEPELFNVMDIDLDFEFKLFEILLREKDKEQSKAEDKEDES